MRQPLDARSRRGGKLARAAGTALLALSAAAGVYYAQHALGAVQVQVTESHFLLDSKSGDGGILESIVKAAAGNVIIESRVRVENPTAFSATLERATSELSVDGAVVGTGSTPTGVEQVIDADGHSFVNMQTRIPVSKLARLAMGGSPSTVKMRGRAQIRILGMSVEQEFSTDMTRLLKGGALGDVLSQDLTGHDRGVR